MQRTRFVAISRRGSISDFALPASSLKSGIIFRIPSLTEPHQFSGDRDCAAIIDATLTENIPQVVKAAFNILFHPISQSRKDFRDRSAKNDFIPDGNGKRRRGLEALVTRNGAFIIEPQS